MSAIDRRQVLADFRCLVNMSAEDLTAWLDTPESLAVGQKKDGGESVGHASGRRIVSILRTAGDAPDESDLAHMRRTIGFIRRHRAQEPANMVTSRWRYSLMNWGHDPLLG
ncbi:MAG TPA: DUF3140 domain-containing protein [Allosphingosinicella sp.]